MLLWKNYGGGKPAAIQTRPWQAKPRQRLRPDRCTVHGAFSPALFFTWNPQRPCISGYNGLRPNKFSRRPGYAMACGKDCRCQVNRWGRGLQMSPMSRFCTFSKTKPRPGMCKPEGKAGAFSKDPPGRKDEPWAFCNWPQRLAISSVRVSPALLSSPPLIMFTKIIFCRQTTKPPHTAWLRVRHCIFLVYNHFRNS